MLPDVQDEADRRGIPIDAVGVAGVRHPIHFTDGVSSHQGIGQIDITVGLVAERRGTHMSRMIEFANEHLQVFDPREFPVSLKNGMSRLATNSMTVSVSLEAATQVTAPVSNRVGWQPFELTVIGRGERERVAVETMVAAEVTTLCPCSQAISDYGAHNQRSKAALTVVGVGDDPYPVPVAEMLGLIRSVGSSPVFPLVKREDERALTMAAFDRPAFVEDLVRDLSAACRDRGVSHRIDVRNLESIHTHDAVASVAWMADDGNGTSG